MKISKFFCLTKSEKCAIIIKLSDESPKAKNTKKNFQKSLKKDLTNKTKCDIIDKSPWEPDGSRRVQRKAIETAFQKALKKVFQKNLKKGLTNERKCGIINKSSARRTLLKNGTASWKVNNTKARKKELNPCQFDLRIEFKRSQKKDYKRGTVICERIVIELILISEKSDLRYKLMKSLILAQDERWRHA